MPSLTLVDTTIATGHRPHLVTPDGKRRISGFTHICHMGVGDHEEWYTTGYLRYYDAKLDYLVEVPPWFINDLASIPRLGRLLIPKNGYNRFGAVVHDKLCVSGELSRAEGDRIFKEACYIAGCKRWRVQGMYWPVRAWSTTFAKHPTEDQLVANPEQHFVDIAKLPLVNRRQIVVKEP